MPGITRGVERSRIRQAGALWLALLLVAAARGSAPAPLADSRFGFRASVEGQAFDAHFTRFSVRPRIDRRGLPGGFEVEVDLRAVDSGDAERDAEMQAAAWFDTARFPQARYRTDRVEQRAAGGFVAQGELVLKGVARPVEVPFTWWRDGGAIQMTGEVPLDRRWFGVGPDDTDSVAATVTVRFDLRWRGP